MNTRSKMFALVLLMITLIFIISNNTYVNAIVTSDNVQLPIGRNFQYIIDNETYELPYIKTGSIIRVDLNNSFNGQILIIDMILNHDGTPRYPDYFSEKIDLKTSEGMFEFRLRGHPAIALNSEFYPDSEGNLYRGFKVIYGTNEFSFILRTDC